MNTTSPSHYIGKISQKAIIANNNNVLVCRGVGDSLWEFPGGRLDANEDPTQGVQREVREEFNLEIKNVRLFRIEKSFHFKENAPQILVIYTATADTADFVMNDESEEAKWIPKSELTSLPLFPDSAKVVSIYLQLP